MSLGNDGALIRRLNGFERFDWPEAKLREPFGFQAHGNTRRAGRRFHLHVGVAGHRLEHPRDLLGFGIKDFEIVAEDVHHHWRGLASDRFPDAIAKESQHLELQPGKLLQNPANLARHFFLFLARDPFQIDVKLAPMRPPGIFSQFGAADLLLDGLDVFVFKQFVRNSSADAEHFRQRSPRRGEDLQNEVAFAEFGQKLAAEKRQACRRRDANQRHQKHDRAGPPGHETERPAVGGLEPALESRLAGFAHPAIKEKIGQRRRHRQRDQQRRHNGEDITKGQRGEKAALQPGQGQDGQKN